MFDANFTFDTPRSPSLDSTSHTISTRETSRSLSPCSPTGPYPPPRFSVTDLAASFASSRLRHDSQICYDSCEAYANNDDDAGWEIPRDDVDLAPVSRSRTLPARPHSPSRRMQRQANTRLLCSTTHTKDIEALVSRMVACQDQCEVNSDSASPTIEVDDEGYDSPDANQSRRSSIAVQKTRFDYRRSSDMRATGARVNKTVRCKKDQKHRRIRSAESES
ncbi:hypothetical protein HII31_09637 [Pseudocercospora fuligena]|uniref:Uncharacterized protein n=1 Tax=Pseudocercospora fuligena TaxID=685502 RepID=A0A8H6VI90_9PEZI|nr:hypothetical protein HII31_09637 [Pseudocercospora fuligena]